MSDTIFHRIVRGEIPAEVIYEDRMCIAIEDINPQAPFHIILLPKLHVFMMSLLDKVEAPAASTDLRWRSLIVGHLCLTGADLAEKAGYTGFRTVINTATDPDTVPYLHAHVLAGCEFAWPPGTILVG